MRGKREIRRRGFQEFLEDIVGKHAAPAGELCSFIVECEQAAFGERSDDRECTGNPLVAELLPEDGNRNSTV